MADEHSIEGANTSESSGGSSESVVELNIKTLDSQTYSFHADKNGLAKYVEWSANMMEEDARRRLKLAKLQAKKERIRIWTNYVPPPSNSKAIHNQNFTGKVELRDG
ncbi:hypothetical protein Ancab_004671 [Ancistrocladus abbreviatus]